MGMRNPFSGEPGDERQGEPAQPHGEPVEPPTTEAEPPRERKGPKKREHHLLHEGEFTAPSVGPHTVIDRPPPDERLDFDRISDTDAMGEDKRRQVVGGTYGPTRARVFATFATFFAVVAALVFGFYLLANELDQPPEENPDVAPWSRADAPQTPPRPLQ